MKKVLTISILFSVPFLLTFQSLFILSTLTKHKAFVKASKASLLTKCNYLDINDAMMYVNTKEICWLEDELKLYDCYFDVVKTEKLQNGKHRIYIYFDKKEDNISDQLKIENHIKNKSAKKLKHNLLSELLKLKSYNPQNSICVYFTSTKHDYFNLVISPKDGYYFLPYQPPSFVS